jgi:DNA-directed RNA polymerase subunit RPC12/RpoP
MVKEPGFVHGAIRCPNCGSPMTGEYVERISLFCEVRSGRPMVLGTGFTCLYCGEKYHLHADLSDMLLQNSNSNNFYDTLITVPVGDL